MVPWSTWPKGSDNCSEAAPAGAAAAPAAAAAAPAAAAAEAK